jgi:hypothetical protein
MTAWVSIANVEDLPQGETPSGHRRRRRCARVNLGDRYVAIGAECTHAGCFLSDGSELDLEQGVVTYPGRRVRRSRRSLDQLLAVEQRCSLRMHRPWRGRPVQLSTHTAAAVQLFLMSSRFEVSVTLALSGFFRPRAQLRERVMGVSDVGGGFRARWVFLPSLGGSRGR